MTSGIFAMIFWRNRAHYTITSSDCQAIGVESICDIPDGWVDCLEKTNGIALWRGVL